MAWLSLAYGGGMALTPAHLPLEFAYLYLTWVGARAKTLQAASV